MLDKILNIFKDPEVGVDITYDSSKLRELVITLLIAVVIVILLIKVIK